MNSIDHLCNYLYVKNYLTPLIMGTYDNVTAVNYIEQCGGRYGSIKVTYTDRKDKYINITDCKNRREIAMKAIFNV